MMATRDPPSSLFKPPTTETIPSFIRNEIKGTVISVTLGDILSEIILDTASGEISSIITTRSVTALDLKPGDPICAQIKATNVSLCKCDCQHH